MKAKLLIRVKEVSRIYEFVQMEDGRMNQQNMLYTTLMSTTSVCMHMTVDKLGEFSN